jgi:uncharacterized protein (DUF488 family)
MIERAGRPVTHLEMTKWAFLTALEMPSGGGSSFYDFLPYRYGPFSFAMFRELNGLVQKGYLRDAKWNDHDAWEFVGEMRGSVGSLPQDVQGDAARVVERFIGKSDNELIDYVYERFPWYTANSNIRKLESRPVADTAVYTVGYEGCSIDGLLNVLMQQGIQRIVDVRRNPVARRYGFHKSSLTRLCGNVGIDYVHVPEVGIPSELRQELDSPSDYAQLFDRYERELLPKATDTVQAISELIVEKPTTLMCMEADPNMCHRTRLAGSLAAITNLPICHIQGKHAIRF